MSLLDLIFTIGMIILFFNPVLGVIMMFGSLILAALVSGA